MRPPEPSDVASIAEDLGLHLSEDAIAAYAGVSSALWAGFEAIDGLSDGLPEVKYPDRRSRRPTEDDNPLGAWHVRTEIDHAPSGKLHGRTIAVKDNVMVAEVPLLNGTRILEGYVPAMDATVVTRILDAGGSIVGKSACEAYCLSGGSHTSETGPVHNPHRHGYSAGGSSSGSAALVAAGEVDLAIGCDQAGSIRIPSSWCGAYGMKPTHGLVPYTGILGMDPTIDYAGPITASVEDNALFLEILAGADGLDPRQKNPRVDEYTGALGQGVDRLRIGVLEEGFGLDESEPDVDAKVRAASERLGTLGADVSSVSVPMHGLGGAILFGAGQSVVHTMFHSDGLGMGREEALEPGLPAIQSSWRERPDDLPETVKSVLILSEFVRREHGHRLYARAVNLFRQLRGAYDEALGEVDLLLLPTTAMKAQQLPPPDAPIEVQVGSALANLANTAPFNVSHHPAMSIPCGTSDGLPVGMMLVGRHWEESTIYLAAHAFEQHEDWTEL